MTKFTHYVAGFMFDQNNLDRVALVEKKRPNWQAGKLNAIGGHVEPLEQPIDAMVREFVEETGMQTAPDDWIVFATLTGTGHHVDFYVAMGDVDSLTTTTDEQIMVFHKDCITAYNSIPNLTWLVPLAQLALKGMTQTLIVSEV